MGLFSKKERPKHEMLQIRKLADRSTEERVVRYDPITGERKLVNPLTADVDDPSKAGEWLHEAWPLAGVEFVGDPPQFTSVAQTYALKAEAEGWLQFENFRIEARPGGPVDQKWNPNRVHNFAHADALIFKTVNGPVKYLVTRQPDKYAVKGDDVEVTDSIYAAGDTTVSWIFHLELSPDQDEVS